MKKQLPLLCCPEEPALTHHGSDCIIGVFSTRLWAPQYEEWASASVLFTVLSLAPSSELGTTVGF